MFDTIADMLRGSAPDDLAHALGTDRTQTRRAMEIGLPALITGLRDKTLEPGGAQNLASMLDEPSAAVPRDVDAYLAAGDPSQGAAMLDVAFGDRGEPALAALSDASGLSTRLLAQVMSVLAPLATGTVAGVADRSPQGLRAYLSDAVDDLEGKGFGRVVELVSPADLASSAIVPESTSADLDPVSTDVDLDEDGGGGVIVEGAFPDASVDVSIDEEMELEDLADSDSGIDLPDTGLEMPDVDSAETGLEMADVDLPDTGLEMADVDLPDTGLDMPDADLPAVEIPPLDGPDLVAPDLSTPDLATPDLATPDLATPDFDAEVGAVAPAGVSIAPEPNYGGGMATGVLPEAEGDVVIDTDQPDLDIEGKGLSSMGWIWWMLGAILAIVLLALAISRCSGSDDGDTAAVDSTSSSDTDVDPTPDPAEAQRQATLDGIIAEYPGVSGEVFGDVAVLDGTVADDTERALLDQAVRAAGLGVQNNVVAEAAPAAGVEGYSINDLIDAQPQLSTLKALLAQAGLGDALGGTGPFTLFAPTNEAFAAISDSVAELQGDPDRLQEVLRYHLLIGAQDAATVAGSETLATQLDGESIAVSSADGVVTLNGSARVIVPDATARNGVIHFVDAVLLPEAAAAPLPEEIGAELGLNPITFALGSSELTDEGKVELDKVVLFLLANPGNIEIGGHTDSDGEPDFNQKLSQDRANAVKTYLSGQGIPAESMTAVGFGEDQPIAANDTPENKALNRRIEFRPS